MLLVKPPFFVTMNNLRPFQHYFTLFYFVGLNSYVSFSDTTKKSPKLISILHRLITISITLFFLQRMNKRFNDALDSSPISQILLMVIRLQYATLVSTLENICNEHLVRRTLITLSFIIQSFETILKTEFPYKRFKRSVEWKFLLQVIMYFVILLMKMFFLIHMRNEWVIKLILAIHIVIKYVNIFHFLFYADFIIFSLTLLNQQFINMISERNALWCREQYEQCLCIMNRMKMIHFKLWKISQNANSLFGWFLVAITIELIEVIAGEMFWIFLIATNRKQIRPIDYILRNYSINFN